MSIAKNYFYNLSYQIASIIIPFITIPYISRVIGSSGVGVAAFTNSIVQYFILLGTLGISLYGNRTIAYVRDDIDKRSKVFWEIFTFKLITTSISYLTFLILFYFRPTEYRTLYLIQSINILAAAADISWLFMGLEDFGKVVARNFMVKVGSIAFIFTFVKSPDDVWIYVLISALGNLIGQAIMFFYIPRYVKFVKVSIHDALHHFLPTLKLFIPQVAIQLYVVLDKTMLGILSTQSEVGIYTYSQRIVKAVLVLVTSLGTVMLPRVSNVYAKGDMDGVKTYVKKSFNFASYLSIPMAFMLAGISKGFVSWFFGKDFYESYKLIIIMSPIIAAVAWSNVFGVQLMLPMKKEKEFTISVTGGAIVNFVLNLLLIPTFKATGASIATLVAEFVVTSIQMLIMWKIVKGFFKEVYKYFIASVVMLFCILWLYRLLDGIALTISQIVVGALVYFAIMWLFKAEIQRDLIRKILNVKMNKS